MFDLIKKAMWLVLISLLVGQREWAICLALFKTPCFTLKILTARSKSQEICLVFLEKTQFIKTILKTI
jgi:hypothetical protein